ncbi:hypothetical protein BRARA_A02940 [Brassica rapa]|uniref:RING-type domain-containing protein n=1 Tax=Brassica campestris TaxID=3711 RepID=A0A398ARB4_BRACM|nr:hypothetical protein BRARA_A02940 [Brassica rapa]
MATPLPDFEATRAASSSSTTVISSSVPSSSRPPAANSFSEDAEEISPILFFLFFHKAVCSELESLHRLALEFATGHHVDLRLLRERYRFLRSIYKHHCNAEDEVIFSALDIRVKNVAQTYSLEHKGESTLFDHLFELLNPSTEIDESYRRELASSTGALQTSVSQHLAKEQKQVFPLLIEKFKHEEQAYIVWRFLCSIPVNMLAVFLPWLASSISVDESKEMQTCLSKIVPDEKLLQQVIFTWLGRKSDTAASCRIEDSLFQCCIDSSSSMLPCETSRAQCACEGTKVGKRKYQELTSHDSFDTQMHPIDEIKLWHKAMNKEMKEIADEARKIQLSGDFSDLSAFDELNHKCLEKSLETNCPICCEFLFTSSETVRALPCGHYMHSACFQAYTCSHYTCPICGKTLGDMGVYFGMLDALLAAEELPEEYKDRCQDILCNDCQRKGTTQFHWLYHKCGSCGSYNTRVIRSETAAPDCPTSS